MEDIIVTAITICVPSTATIVTALIQSKTMNRHAARNSILQLIMEDHLAVQEGKLPTNYQSVLLEYDNYRKAGGNSYVTEKVEEYKKWFKEQEEKKEEVRE